MAGRAGVLPALSAAGAPISTGSVSDLVDPTLAFTTQRSEPLHAGTAGIAGSPAELLCWGAIPARTRATARERTYVTSPFESIDPT
jgi:hypothetical protein